MLNDPEAKTKERDGKMNAFKDAWPFIVFAAYVVVYTMFLGSYRFA